MKEAQRQGEDRVSLRITLIWDGCRTWLLEGHGTYPWALWVPSGARHQSWCDTCQCVTFVWISNIFSASFLKQFLHNLQWKLLTPKIHIVTSDIHTKQKNCHSKHYTLSISFKLQRQVYHFLKKLMSDSQLGHVGCCLILMYGRPFAWSNLASQLLLFHQVQFAKLPTPHHQVANLPSALYCLKCSSSCAELEFYNLLIFWADGWNWLTKWNFF